MMGCNHTVTKGIALLCAWCLRWTVPEEKYTEQVGLSPEWCLDRFW